MHRVLVDEKKWISEQRFLHALNYCMLLPGPEAQQLATYIGWLLHRVPGGLMAGLLFIFPGFVSILALSCLYAEFHHVGLVAGAFLGLKAGVLAIVVEAVERIAKKALKYRLHVVLAGLAFLALFVFRIPFPVVILVAGLIGGLGQIWAPQWFLKPKSQAAAKADTDGELRPVDRLVHEPYYQPHAGRSLLIFVICIALWIAPLAGLWALYGPENIYLGMGLFFSQAALVTFGGAYSVLAFVAQRAVEHYSWVTHAEMLDGLGLAETTPGPLIMVVQFVAFLGAFHHPEQMSPLAAGMLASVITVWVTFLPCFLYIFVGAPYVERLRKNRFLEAALGCITAAVVGVVLNLAVELSLKTLFGTVAEHNAYGARWLLPELGTVRLLSVGILGIACVQTFVVKHSLFLTLGTCSVLGLGAWLLGA